MALSKRFLWGSLAHWLVQTGHTHGMTDIGLSRARRRRTNNKEGIEKNERIERVQRTHKHTTHPQTQTHTTQHNTYNAHTRHIRHTRNTGNTYFRILAYRAMQSTPCPRTRTRTPRLCRGSWETKSHRHWWCSMRWRTVCRRKGQALHIFKNA